MVLNRFGLGEGGGDQAYAERVVESSELKAPPEKKSSLKATVQISSLATCRIKMVGHRGFRQGCWAHTITLYPVLREPHMASNEQHALNEILTTNLVADRGP